MNCSKGLTGREIRGRLIKIAILSKLLIMKAKLLFTYHVRRTTVQ